MNSGDLVTPNIRLTRLLGEGGMGSVWVADHLTLQTQVVVKFIQGAHVSNADIVSRFQREAALAAQARSPHVVQVFDHGLSHHGTPFIAMEFLRGEDLGAYLDREGVAPVAVYADWLRQIAKGLTRTHAQGIIHRDIKPENLFLSEADGEITVKLLDFGVAKGDPASGFASTNTGAVVGTVYYMSPEQALGSHTIDYRTDLWALGVVSYLALTGNRPFTGTSIVQLLTAITAGKFRPPSHWRPELGAEVDAWMERVLSTDPAQRHPSAKAMAEAFIAAVQTTHGPLKALSDSQPEPIRPLTDPLGDRTLAASISPTGRDDTIAASDVSPSQGRRAWLVAGSVAALVVIGIVAYRASVEASASDVASASQVTSSEQVSTDAAPVHTAPPGASAEVTSSTRAGAASASASVTAPTTSSAPSNTSAPASSASAAISLGQAGLQRPRPVAVTPALSVAPQPSPAPPAAAPSPAPKSPLQMNLE